MHNLLLTGQRQLHVVESVECGLCDEVCDAELTHRSPAAITPSCVPANCQCQKRVVTGVASAKADCLFHHLFWHRWHGARGSID